MAIITYTYGHKMRILMSLTKQVNKQPAGKIANKNTIPVRVWFKQFIKVSIGVALIVLLTLYVLNA
ncbi:MAG: hypothetical protein Q8K36_01865 [Alphaproteobacteria bacterium]|nr:hypothetical protein [Alphaproteobacteria bacterium]